MKTTILSFIILLFTLPSINSQCSVRTSTFQNGDYVVTGTARLEFSSTGKKILSFDNFSTMAGPDVDVYLSNTNNSVTGGIKISDVSYSTTSQYTVPTGIDINDYQYIVLWCTDFGQYWGFGQLSAETTATCVTTLSVDNNFIDKIGVYPNPTSDIIHISGTNINSAEIRIFDFLGKTVFQKNNNLDQEINLSHLKKGIYLLQINNQGKINTKKIVLK